MNWGGLLIRLTRLNHAPVVLNSGSAATAKSLAISLYFVGQESGPPADFFDSGARRDT
jgi:hypothetical protein